MSCQTVPDSKRRIRPPAEVSLSWPQVLGHRLARHHLLAPAPPERLAEVAGDVCGVHAQMGVSSELMLGARVAGITRQDVRAALWEKRTLVKTVGVRGTLHLFPADEVPTWMAANRLRFESEERRRGRTGIDLARFFAVVDAISDAVGPEPISVPELERELEVRVGGWAVAKNEGWVGSYRNWPLALGWAAALGRVCYGPGQGGRTTFVRLADWSAWREEDPFESGLFVTLNSDDPPMFGTNLLDEYVLAYDHYGFTPDQLRELAANSAEASFLPPHQKLALISRIEQYR